MQQQQLLDEEERMPKRQERRPSDGNVALTDVEYSSNAGGLSLQFWILTVWIFMIDSSCTNYSFASILQWLHHQFRLLKVRKLLPLKTRVQPQWLGHFQALGPTGVLVIS